MGKRGQESKASVSEKDTKKNMKKEYEKRFSE